MAFNDPLHDALYGGPLPEATLVEALAAHGLRFPVRVSVVEETAAHAAAWAYVPGDGLAYLTDGGIGRRAGWRLVDCPADWPYEMQQCILALRRERRPGVAMDTSPETADQLRRLALQQCQQARPEWRDAVRCWAEVTLLRTEQKIHDTHRAFLAFLLEAGEPLGTIGSVGHRHHHALQQLLAAYTGAALTHWLMEGLGMVQEQIARKNRRLDPPMRRALALIDSRLTEEISLDDVAATAGMTPAAFSRKFKAVIGQTYTSHVQALRLERAIPLLRRTNRTVLDIALDCGFGSVEQFHRVFKQRLGTTPLAYRRGRLG